jgi:hypothetical protein
MHGVSKNNKVLFHQRRGVIHGIHILIKAYRRGLRKLQRGIFDSGRDYFLKNRRISESRMLMIIIVVMGI